MPSGSTVIEETPQMLTNWITEQEVFLKDQIVVVNDLENTPKLNSTLRRVFHEELAAAALMSAPLVSAGRWIGHIFTASQM